MSVLRKKPHRHLLQLIYFTDEEHEAQKWLSQGHTNIFKARVRIQASSLWRAPQSGHSILYTMIIPTTVTGLPLSLMNSHYIPCI